MQAKILIKESLRIELNSLFKGVKLISFSGSKILGLFLRLVVKALNFLLIMPRPTKKTSPYDQGQELELPAERWSGHYHQPPGTQHFD